MARFVCNFREFRTFDSAENGTGECACKCKCIASRCTCWKRLIVGARAQVAHLKSRVRDPASSVSRRRFPNDVKFMVLYYFFDQKERFRIWMRSDLFLYGPWIGYLIIVASMIRFFQCHNEDEIFFKFYLRKVISNIFRDIMQSEFNNDLVFSVLQHI